MLRLVIALLVCLQPLVSAFAVPGALTTSRSVPAVSSAHRRRPPPRPALCARSLTRRVLRRAVAHHVQKKATRAHNAFRPRKSRPSDIYRKPPQYPPLPDIPWYTKLESGSSSSSAAAAQ